MPSISELGSAINTFEGEFNEIADELKISFDTASGLLIRLVLKLNEFNALIKFTQNEFDEIVAACLHSRTSMQRLLDDEVELRLKRKQHPAPIEMK